MSKEMSFWVQPRCLLLLAAFTIFLVLALSHTRKEEEEEKQVAEDYQVTHRVFLDIDIEGQRLGEHVVFGKVIQGMDNVFAIEGGAGTYSGKPRKKVVIADSGEIPKDKWDEE
ncbi:hypothetical protein F2Q68_00006436 [Brassica cretica]|uniref:PPIase cyclophilin-type domain-containing protein n=1 Tax=Brassica cretica TaxID=69181 RepID=A0A8S9JEL8_BRACR|nr:hypothetical protein F2Q68_00006436 [Brassica cretica]